jgi:prepilin peptidase CpaA
MARVDATALAAFLTVAAVWDLRQRRIPNPVVAWFTVLALALAASGGRFAAALAGLAVGLAVLLPAFSAGALGAGDVKFFAAVGVFLGPRLTLSAFVLGSAWGALAVLPPRWWPAPAGGADAGGIPYAVPLGLGTTSAVLLDWLGRPLL